MERALVNELRAAAICMLGLIDRHHGGRSLLCVEKTRQTENEWLAHDLVRCAHHEFLHHGTLTTDRLHSFKSVPLISTM